MTRRLLNISDDLKLAADAITQTIVVYGMKGQGKTVLGAVLCEEFASAGQKFCYLDPIGPGYGLRYSKDGKGKGLDILVLGGRQGDLPIEPTGGAVVADLVADNDVNVVIDISRDSSGKMWGAGQKIRFVADYCTRLYERQGERCFPIHQIIDEAGRFCPQTIPAQAPDLARCVGAIEQMVELGRNVGIGVTLITQRSARMNKSVSELAECMIAFRTVGPNSVGAVLDWLGEHIPKSRHNEMVEKLRTLPKGVGLVVSPGWLEFEGVVRFRMRDTFDSSATPTADRKLISAKPLDDKALEKYRGLMVDTIEKAKADDPRELKRKLIEKDKEIFKLKTEVANQRTAPAEVKTREVLILDGKARQALDSVAAALVRSERIITADLEHVREVAGKLEEVKSFVAFATANKREAEPPIQLVKGVTPERIVPRPPVVPPMAPGLKRFPEEIQNGEIKLSTCHRKILAVLNQFRDGCLMGKILLLSGYREQGSFIQALADLRKAGMITGQNRELMRITHAGIDQGPFPEIPQGAQLREYWLSHPSLSQCAQKILRVLIDDPSGLTMETIAERCVPPYRIQGSFVQALADLRTAGLITGQNRDQMKPADLIYG